MLPAATTVIHVRAASLAVFWCLWAPWVKRKGDPGPTVILAENTLKIWRPSLSGANYGFPLLTACSVYPSREVTKACLDCASFRSPGTPLYFPLPSTEHRHWHSYPGASPHTLKGPSISFACANPAVRQSLAEVPPLPLRSLSACFIFSSLSDLTPLSSASHKVDRWYQFHEDTLTHLLGLPSCLGHRGC